MSNMKKRLAQTLANYSCSKNIGLSTISQNKKRLNEVTRAKDLEKTVLLIWKFLEPFRWWFIKQTLIPLCAKAKEERECSCRQMPTTQCRRGTMYMPTWGELIMTKWYFRPFLEVNSIALLKSQQTFQQSFYSSVGHPVVLETLLKSVLKSLLRFQQSYWIEPLDPQNHPF